MALAFILAVLTVLVLALPSKCKHLTFLKGTPGNLFTKKLLP